MDRARAKAQDKVLDRERAEVLDRDPDLAEVVDRDRA
jgi:hypothetical protein